MPLVDKFTKEKLIQKCLHNCWIKKLHFIWVVCDGQPQLVDSVMCLFVYRVSSSPTL